METKIDRIINWIRNGLTAVWLLILIHAAYCSPISHAIVFGVVIFWLAVGSAIIWGTAKCAKKITGATIHHYNMDCSINYFINKASKEKINRVII